MPKQILFVATETTGLDVDKHEVIDVAVLDMAGAVLLSTKIRPLAPELASPEAVEVTGYADKAWADAPTMAEMAPRISSVLRGAILCGHNVQFDVQMLRRALERVDSVKSATGQEIDEGPLSRDIGFHQVDTLSLAIEHLFPKLQRFSLGAVCEHLGLEPGKHDALSDAHAVRRVYLKLARASIFDRLRWRL